MKRTLPYPHVWREKKFPDVMEAPANERESLMVQRRADMQKRHQEKQGICGKCSLLKTDQKNTCICEILAQLRPCEAPHFDCAVYMHVKERFRSSNSGKLLEHLYDSPVFIDSDKESMEKLAKLIENNKERALVLFPDENAITIDQTREKDILQNRPLIIVVDGTWGQASRLNKNIDPQIPRVKINPTTISSFECRTQTQIDRVCTVEAVTMLLRELDEEQEADRLITALGYLQAAFNLQTFHVPERPENRMKKLLKIDNASTKLL